MSPPSGPILPAVIGFIIVRNVVAWTTCARLRDRRPSVRPYLAGRLGPRHVPSLWDSRGSMRTPLGIWGISASWPLAVYTATAAGIEVRGVFPIPRLESRGKHLRAVERARFRGLVFVARDPDLKIRALGIRDRGELLEIARNQGVDVGQIVITSGRAAGG